MFQYHRYVIQLWVHQKHTEYVQFEIHRYKKQV